jgi:hypothetical protein
MRRKDYQIKKAVWFEYYEWKNGRIGEGNCEWL